MRNKKEFKGKTVEAAIDEGLKKLELDKDKVNVEILNEGKAGLFGLMGAEPAKVKLNIKEESSKNTLIDSDYSHKRAKEIAGLLIKSIDKEADFNIEKKDGGLLIDIISEESSLLIGKKGQTLNALEYIFNLLMKRDPKSRINIEVDIEGYKKKKISKIINRAEEKARQVKKSGKPEKLPPMKAADRKKIHKAINSIEGIDTESKGEGRSRRIMIKKA